MKCGIHLFLGIYAVLDITLALLSSVGWVYYWRLSKFALFIQNYDLLKFISGTLPDDMNVNVNNNQESQRLEKKQMFIKFYCGTDATSSVSDGQTKAHLEFDDMIASILAPSVAMCSLAMFGFIVGGILIGIMINISHKSSVMILGITVVLVELVSSLILLGGALVVLHKKLCAVEVLFGIRTCLLGSVFFTLVLYKLYEFIMIIRFIAIQSKISAEQNSLQVSQNGERAVG